jgi:L-lysine exporter family protein LysE/ArgO
MTVRIHCGQRKRMRPSARALRSWFVAGASAASMLWFGLLGYGARWLAPWFARPRAWRMLDGLVGLTMMVLAALLVGRALTGF